MVKATLRDFSKEGITIINGDEDGGHTFHENGAFIFEIQERAGNIGFVKAEVTWIVKDNDNKLVFNSNVNDNNDNGIITNIDENTSIANNSSYNTGQFSSNSLWVSADEVSSAVKDNKDKSAEDKNNASIKDNVSGSNELTNDTSSSNERVETNNYLLLWVIIAFIVILVLLFIFIRFKRDNSKE